MSDTQRTISSPNDFTDDAEGLQQYWRSEIESSKRELKKWQESGKTITKNYLDNRTVTNNTKRNFNLFAANTGILKASLYARIPKPEVSRRFTDFDDDVARVAGNILERALSYELESDPSFDINARNAIEDRLIPGLGVVWVRYDATTEEHDIQITDDVTENTEDEELEYRTQTETVITDENTPIDYVHWLDFYYSPARTKSEIRWVARRVYMTKDELTDRFGEDMAKQVDMTAVSSSEKGNSIEPKNNVLQQGEVFEIWDKTSKRIIWLSLTANEVLDVRDDVLELEGFFPCPTPLIANTTTSNFIPTPDYALVQDQYEELNQLNNRISYIVEACKVAGVYDADAKGIEKLLLDGRENILIPVDRWAAFNDKGGVKGAIQFLPITEMANVLSVLQTARDVVKAQIYELTGISDIIRGATNPYETAAAQNIKSQYASLRLGSLQNEVAHFFSEVVKKKAHLMVKFYEPERLLARCGQMNKADEQYIGPALQLLKSEALSKFRIIVSVDALLIPNLDAEKAQRTEAVMAISAMLEKSIPVIQHSPELAPLLLNLIKWNFAGFRQTKDLEGIVDSCVAKLQADQAQQQGQPKPPTPQQMEFQSRQQKQEQDFQLAQADLQLRQAVAQNTFALEQQKLQLKAEELEIEKIKFQINTQITATANQTEAALQNRALDIKATHTHMSNFDAFNETTLKHNISSTPAENLQVNNNAPSNLLGGDI